MIEFELRSCVLYAKNTIKTTANIIVACEWEDERLIWQLLRKREPGETGKVQKPPVMLEDLCQQIWKTQQWPQDWKMSVFISIPKKSMPKNVQTTAQLHSSHMLAK